MKTLNDYLMPTGYYDEGAIMVDAGESERHARFAAIFGDAQGTPDLGAAYNALLAEARRLNAEMFAAARQAETDEARALVAQEEPWSLKTWHRLVDLGFASMLIDDSERGLPAVSCLLTERGEQLLDPSFRSPGLYADQAGIEG